MNLPLRLLSVFLLASAALWLVCSVAQPSGTVFPPWWAFVAFGAAATAIVVTVVLLPGWLVRRMD